MIIVGVDVGGTFTDLVLADTAQTRTVVHKVASTPDDPSRAVLQGLVELCGKARVETASVSHVLHGTTVATNAMLEHKGARTGMMTTEGYRDILHIGRHQRPSTTRSCRRSPGRSGRWSSGAIARRCSERLVPPRGEVLEPLDEEDVRAAARALKERASRRSPSAFCSPISIRRTRSGRKQILERGAVPRCFVTTSSSVSPQFREFERFTTTAMNAFVGPKVRDYVERARGVPCARRASRPICACMALERRRRHAGDGGRAAGADLAVGPGGRRARRRLGGALSGGATSSPSTSAAPAPISAS